MKLHGCCNSILMEMNMSAGHNSVLRLTEKGHEVPALPSPRSHSGWAASAASRARSHRTNRAPENNAAISIPAENTKGDEITGDINYFGLNSPPFHLDDFIGDDEMIQYFGA
ncbi:unnamed protein product [Vicia faba]|uniref:Uncharacterized protein n=1 Tax=Vicia faba TaxID=3906 RepID=A0AAV0Z3W6_VICFA|nr:unnamed protein product [Vicia faba]